MSLKIGSLCSGYGGLDLAVEAVLDTWEDSRAELAERGYNGNGRGTPIAVAVRQEEKWGQYAAAIARWEAIAREAPAPTELGTKGNPRLSPLFTEWMMGLPAGWITDVPGVTRNEALKLCGNGVVPQQAEAALRFLLPLIAGEPALEPSRHPDPPLLGTPTARDHKGSGQGKRLAESARRGQVEGQILMLGREVSDATSL